MSTCVPLKAVIADIIPQDAKSDPFRLRLFCQETISALEEVIDLVDEHLDCVTASSSVPDVTVGERPINSILKAPQRGKSRAVIPSPSSSSYEVNNSQSAPTEGVEEVMVIKNVREATIISERLIGNVIFGSWYRPPPEIVMHILQFMQATSCYGGWLVLWRIIPFIFIVPCSVVHLLSNFYISLAFDAGI